MGEQANLRAVAEGRKLPVNAPIVAPAPPPAPVTASDDVKPADPIAPPPPEQASDPARLALLR